MKRKPNLRRLKRSLRCSSPTLLCCAAAVGVVATAIAAVRATPKALIAEGEAEEKKGDKLTKMEWLRMVGPHYILPVGLGVGTIVCIFSANIISRKQQESLAGAYALLDQSYRDYKAKVKELYGVEAHQAITDAIVKDKCSNPPLCAISNFGIGEASLDVDDSAVPEVTRTFYDVYSKRYFESTLSHVMQAEYHLNRNFMLGMDISVNDFYEFLGLDPIKGGDDVGWCICDDYFWIDFDHRTINLDDGMEVVMIEMCIEPWKDFLNYFC